MISEKQMMLANNWDYDDVNGWLATEKLWDARCYWDGKDFWSRGSLKVAAPDWFKSGLPNVHLDGGVFCAGNEAEAIDAISFGRFPLHAQFAVYDSPLAHSNYLERMADAAHWIRNCQHAFCVPVEKLSSRKQLAEKVQSVLARGGEGLMLHSPKREYITGRTCEMLKLKWCPTEFLYC